MKEKKKETEEGRRVPSSFLCNSIHLPLFKTGFFIQLNGTFLLCTNTGHFYFALTDKTLVIDI